MIRLVAEVLDKQVVDVNGKNAGRVDGIILELRDGEPPVVAAIEVSPITLLARFNRRLARWYARQERRLGRGQPFRVPWTSIERTRMTVRLDRDVEQTPINAVEDWLREKVVERIPGS